MMKLIRVGDTEIALSSVAVVYRAQQGDTWKIVIYQHDGTSYDCEFRDESTCTDTWQAIEEVLRSEPFVRHGKLGFRASALVSIETVEGRPHPKSIMTFSCGFRLVQPFTNAEVMREDVESLREALRVSGVTLPMRH